MIKLKDIFDPYHSFPIMWTTETAVPIAKAIGAEIVGSVKEKGLSKHDLDLHVETWNESIKQKLESMGFESHGSMVVSPKEARKSGKVYAKGWQRAERFENDNHQVIEVWHDA